MLTAKQDLFKKLAIEGQNIFLTGKAGTGKTFVVMELMAALAELRRNYVAVAPTGIAANNIGGETIHSLFSLPVDGVLDDDSFDSLRYVKSEKRRMWDRIEVVIWDEVSMIRADILDGVNKTLIKNGCDPLYTKQHIFVGDMKQLPPVVDDITRSVMRRSYDGDTYQFSKFYKRLIDGKGLTIIDLDEVQRQSDPEFIEALNVIRDGGKSEYFRQFVGGDIKGAILAPYNRQVAQYNRDGLAAHPGEIFKFEAIIEGDMKLTETTLERTIEVKNGCKAMYLMNVKDIPLRNGTIGIFASHNGCHYFRYNDTDFALEPVKITKKKYIYDANEDRLKQVEIGSITQYPFKLAYALSIHKSQGLTFDEVTIDCREPFFMKQQMYVALSRVRSPSGLRILTR